MYPSHIDVNTSMSPPLQAAFSEEFSPSSQAQQNAAGQSRRPRARRHSRRISAFKTTNSRSVTPRYVTENDARLAAAIIINKNAGSRNARVSPVSHQPRPNNTVVISGSGNNVVNAHHQHQRSQQQQMESQHGTHDLNGLLATMRIKVVPPPKQPPPPPPSKSPDDDVYGSDVDTNLAESSDTAISIPMSPSQVVNPPAFSDAPTPIDMVESDNERKSDDDDDDDDDGKSEKVNTKKRKSHHHHHHHHNNNDKKDNNNNKKDNNNNNNNNNAEDENDIINESDNNNSDNENRDNNNNSKRKYPFGFAAVATAKVDSDSDSTAGLARSAPTKNARIGVSASSSKLPYTGSLWQQQQQISFQQIDHNNVNNNNVNDGGNANAVAGNLARKDSGIVIHKPLPRHFSKGSFSGSTSSLAEGTPPSRGERLSLLIPPHHALRKMNNGGFSTPQKIVTPSRHLKLKNILHDDPFSNISTHTVFVPFQDEL